MITNDAVWLITGCSKGLGRALAEQALATGYRVVATARRAADIADLAATGALLAVELDVTYPAEIKAAVTAAEDRFGGVDVLVNNAGYGSLAAIEEGDDADLRALFETNLFGPLNLVKAVLPGMRARRRGHIVNISSIGSLVTYPGVGYYHMVKFGLEAMSETLAKEAAPLGIGVTVVASGAFRTDFRDPASIKMSATRIDDYVDTAGKSREGTPAGHGKQAGDPVRGPRAIIAAVQAERPPVHLLIGGDALDQLRGKLDEMRRETTPGKRSREAPIFSPAKQLELRLGRDGRRVAGAACRAIPMSRRSAGARATPRIASRVAIRYRRPTMPVSPAVRSDCNSAPPAINSMTSPIVFSPLAKLASISPRRRIMNRSPEAWAW